MNGIPLFEQGNARDALKKKCREAKKSRSSCSKTSWRPRSSRSASCGSAGCASGLTNYSTRTRVSISSGLTYDL